MPERSLLQGRFTLTEKLGGGAMGSVYRAHDTALGRDCAIKLLKPQLLENNEITIRFLREAELMMRLAHPNIVRVQQAGEDAGQPFIVMELARGGTLHARLRATGPLPPRDAARLCAEVLDALALAHREGIVHRDIKPGNVLLSADGTPKLTDFGIARNIHQQMTVRTGRTMGSRGYMAPEQMRSARRAEARSDVYSVGAMLFELLTGRRPPALFTPDIQRAALLDIPPPLNAIVAQATQFEPEARFSSATAMASALRDSLPALPADASGEEAGAHTAQETIVPEPLCLEGPVG